ncbi:PhoD-like phosphatase N-terminal domain-containing protein [Paraburkholderia sp. MPAMCS5]|uniref:PhoD-like phosphatase N-terminal domain-containing protein n=1 Tax=Paraburkholderia sp. MPAMCS5 TaxID=3112563 RepID=UPI002E183305|nr:PhoD-like phosphatase N-terminal domain-containing protein [Paraburkholderia sp. MPAMCS5]
MTFVPVRLDVSPRSDFSPIVAAVPLRASRSFDFTVRAKITGLQPKATYYYRFVAGRDISPIGVTRTAPAWTTPTPKCGLPGLPVRTGASIIGRR